MGDTSNVKGPMSWFGKLTFGILLDQEKVVNAVAVWDAGSIFMKVVLVSEGLTVLVKGMKMSKIRCGHNHVVAEGKLGSHGLQCGMICCIESPLDGSQEIMLNVSQGLNWN